MPLCPTCVVEHTEEHYECNQKPTYVNLHDALQESKQKCYANIVKLEEFNRKNVLVLQFRANSRTISKDSLITSESSWLNARKNSIDSLTKSSKPMREDSLIRSEESMHRMASIVARSARMFEISSQPKLKIFTRRLPN